MSSQCSSFYYIYACEKHKYCLSRNWAIQSTKNIIEVIKKLLTPVTNNNQSTVVAGPIPLLPKKYEKSRTIQKV